MNKIQKKNFEVLKFLAKKFENNKINWILTGSTNLALQGIDVTPNDIDILVKKEDIPKISNILKKYEIEPMHYKESNKIRSFFCVFDIDGIKVEVMNEIEVNVSGSWINTSDFSAKKLLEFEGTKIPVMDLHKEYHFYSKIGRSEKAKLIKKFLLKK